jgi:hypothetical protein
MDSLLVNESEGGGGEGGGKERGRRRRRERKRAKRDRKKGRKRQHENGGKLNSETKKRKYSFKKTRGRGDSILAGAAKHENRGEKFNGGGDWEEGGRGWGDLCTSFTRKLDKF